MSEKKSLLIGEIIDLDLVNYRHLDGYVVPIKGFCASDQVSFDLNDVRIIHDWCIDKQILLIAKMDKIIMEDELDSLDKTIAYLCDLNVDYYMYTDAAILDVFTKKGLLNKLIYSSSKMVASFNEASYYNDLGICVIPSTEISLEEIKKIASLDNVCLTCYGYLDIFYSKRKLISLFNSYQGSSPLRKPAKYKIKEETRDEENIIFENENGTFVFSDFIYLVYRELTNLHPKFLKINSFNIKKTDLFKIIDIYKDAIENGPSIANYDELLDINGKVGSGFLYLKANILNEE